MGKNGKKYPNSKTFPPDEDYVAMLYYKYVNDLYSWGLTFTSQREIVKDCIQDLFAWLLYHRQKLNGINNVHVYLFTSFRNNLLRLLQEKSLNRVNTDIEEDYGSMVSDPVLNVVQKIEEEEMAYSRKKRIRQILHQLSRKQERIIYLRYYMKMDYNEICRILCMNYQSARTLIYRSIQRMREVYREFRLIE